MRCTQLLILYGSQTGTAEDIAKRIARCGKRRRFHVTVTSMDDYQMSNLIKEEHVLFVCATTGQGEEPDNMKAFWTFLLRKTLPANSLASMQYAVIGLGDSSYLKFNFTAKRLHRRLTQLGAQSFVEPVYADDQHEFGADGMIDPWLIHFWDILEHKYPLPPGESVISDDVLDPSNYHLEQLPSDCAADSCPVGRRVFLSLLLENRHMTSTTHFQDVRLLRFSIKGSGIQFEPGDVVMVQPENSPDNVATFFSLFNLNPNTAWKVQSLSGPLMLSQPILVRTCVEKYFDLSYIPKRSFFELFWHFADDELERDKLRELSTISGQEDLIDYVVRPRRTVLEVFADFPHTTRKVPPEYLFDLIPPIRPRPFSIASSLRAHPNEIHVLVAVVEFRTNLQKPRRGLCSTFLASLDAKYGACVPLWVRKGSLRLPPDNTPALMVGPGTGCAPFRGIIQDRCVRNITENVLFFGCRNKARDFFFEEEWKSLVEKRQLDLVTAFSRDQDHKIYVQHRILEEKDKVVDCVVNGATVYIAGSAKSMVPDVCSALKQVLHEVARPGEDGEAFVKRLERLGRLQIEAWS